MPDFAMTAYPAALSPITLSSGAFRIARSWFGCYVRYMFCSCPSGSTTADESK